MVWFISIVSNSIEYGRWRRLVKILERGNQNIGDPWANGGNNS